MKRFFSSLVFKIGLIIVIAEVVVLLVVGTIYIKRFYAEIDARIQSQVQLPGQLMNAGLLSLVSLVDEETMDNLVGEALVDGWAVDENGRIFASLNPDYHGKNISDIPNIDVHYFDFTNPQDFVLTEEDAIISISPIIRPEETTPRLFTYIKVSTDRANAAKQAVVSLFLTGSAFTIIVTSLIIIISFKLAILNRINNLLTTVNKVEAGDLGARTQGKIRGDEIGDLQAGIDAMAEQLEELVFSLENQVAERTHRLEKSLDETKILYAISQQIMQTQNLADLVASVAEEMAIPAINRALLCIFDYDENAQLMGMIIEETWYRGDGPSPTKVGTYYRRQDLDQTFYLRSDPSFYYDVQVDETIKPVGRNLAKRLQIHALVFVPLWSQGRQIGIFILQGDKMYQFTEDEIRPFYSIGSQMAAAVQNHLLVAELEEKVDKRTEELSLSNQRLQSYTEELERSNRELQEFAYISSHDLQEPLRKIQTFSNRLQNKYQQTLDSRGQLYLERMANSAGRMQTLIEDLLAFSRVATHARPFSKVDLNKTLADVLQDLELKIEEVHAHVQLDDLPQIEADSSQMYQLFQNLLSNALKFHKPDVAPKISVTWRLTNGSENNGTTAKQVTIVVQDNGIGFDEKYSERIFSVFQRLHGRSEYEGTGVGLAVCRKIVERHHGDLVAKSKLGDGSTFIVTLPVHQEHTAQKLDPIS